MATQVEEEAVIPTEDVGNDDPYYRRYYDPDRVPVAVGAAKVGGATLVALVAVLWWLTKD